MKHHFAPLFLAAAALAVALALPGVSHAQAFSGGNLERGFRPGVLVPHDGAPFSHRYQYGIGPVLYFGMDARQMWQMDYLDRLDRAERFGYRPPPPPIYPAPRYPRYRPTPRVEWVEPVYIIHEQGPGQR